MEVLLQLVQHLTRDGLVDDGKEDTDERLESQELHNLQGRHVSERQLRLRRPNGLQRPRGTVVDQHSDHGFWSAEESCLVKRPPTRRTLRLSNSVAICPRPEAALLSFLDSCVDSLPVSKVSCIRQPVPQLQVLVVVQMS